MSDECAAVVNEPALADRYRVIDYHRRGWGNSTWPEGLPGDTPQLAADCRGVLDHLGIERAHMVGQSGGGPVILQLAQDAPEAARTLALFEPALPSMLIHPEFAMTAQRLVGRYMAGDKAAAMEAFLREVCGPDFDAARAEMDRFLPTGYYERWLADADPLVRGFLQPPWTFTREDAARIKQPVLNVVGERTRPYFRDIFETLRQWLPQAENIELPGAHHCMLQMNPRGAAERLADFFSRHSLSGA
jgi:pimeloyl-ACP methyl ester carboxylesterase